LRREIKGLGETSLFNRQWWEKGGRKGGRKGGKGTYIHIGDLLVRVRGLLRRVDLPREINGLGEMPLYFIGDVSTGATDELPPVDGVGVDETEGCVVDLRETGREGGRGRGLEIYLCARAVDDQTPVEGFEVDGEGGKGGREGREDVPRTWHANGSGAS